MTSLKRAHGAKRDVGARGRVESWAQSFPFFFSFLRSDETFSSPASRSSEPSNCRTSLRQADRLSAPSRRSLLPAPHPLFLPDLALPRAHVSACSLYGHPFICQWSAARVRQPHNEAVCPRTRQCGEMRRGGRERFSQDRRRICSVAKRHQLKVCNATKRTRRAQPTANRVDPWVGGWGCAVA